MRFFTTVVSFSFPAISALGTVTPLHAIERFNGTTTGRFIVNVKDGIRKENLLAKVGPAVTHNWEILNGFAGAIY
jgi:hypothetical protein